MDANDLYQTNGYRASWETVPEWSVRPREYTPWSVDRATEQETREYAERVGEILDRISHIRANLYGSIFDPGEGDE